MTIILCTIAIIITILFTGHFVSTNVIQANKELRQTITYLAQNGYLKNDNV